MPGCGGRPHWWAQRPRWRSPDPEQLQQLSAPAQASEPKPEPKRRRATAQAGAESSAQAPRSALASDGSSAGKWWEDSFSLLLGDRQVEKQILRLEPEPLVAIHRHREIDRSTGEGRTHVCRIGKSKLEQTEQAFHALVADLDAIVKVVQHTARLRIQPYVPDPARVLDFALRRDRYLNRQKMRDPALQHVRQRGERRLAAIEADRQVETFVALPVTERILLRQHVKVDSSRRRLTLLQQFAQTAEPRGRRVQLDRALVRGHHRAVVENADLLRPKQHLRAARLERVGFVAQHMAQEYLSQLVHEQRRHVHPGAREQPHVSLFEGRGTGQAIAKAQPDAIVFARIRIRDRAQIGLGQVGSRLRQKAIVEGSLPRAGFEHRHQLGAQEKTSQELFGDDEPAVGIGFEQAIAAGGPEFGHGENAFDVDWAAVAVPRRANREDRRSRIYCALRKRVTPRSVGSSFPRKRARRAKFRGTAKRESIGC